MKTKRRKLTTEEIKIKKETRRKEIEAKKKEIERAKDLAIKKKCMIALKVYKKCGVMGRAVTVAGTSRPMLKKYLNRYPKFAAAWNDAYEEYLDSLEEIADYRARAYSDKLLQFLLTGGRKTKYGNVVNVSANAEAKINPESILMLSSEMAKRMDNKIRHKIPVIDAEYEIIDG